MLALTRNHWPERPRPRNRVDAPVATCPECGYHFHLDHDRNPHPVTVGNLTYDPKRRELFIEGHQAHLGGKPLRMLVEMMRRPGELFTLANLCHLTDTWEADPHVVNVMLAKVRKIIRPHAEIRNRWGEGWYLEPTT